jgi:hypothetical protein
MKECFRAACDIKSNVQKVSRQSSRNSNMVSTASEVASKVLANAKFLMRAGAPAHEVLEAGRSVIDDANIGYKQGRRVAYGIGIALPPGWAKVTYFQSMLMKNGCYRQVWFSI